MLIVNLYGAPGAGKSTGAAYVFSRLKMEGVNAELVTEYAKDKVWEGSKAVFENQAYIFGKQFYRISRLKDKVDVVVTDSPLILSCYYGRGDQKLGAEFNTLVKKVAKSYPSFNAYIKRVKPYNPVGRFQTEQESDEISNDLLQFLKTCDIEPEVYPGDISGYDALVNRVLTWMKQQKE